MNHFGRFKTVSPPKNERGILNSKAWPEILKWGGGGRRGVNVNRVVKLLNFKWLRSHPSPTESGEFVSSTINTVSQDLDIALRI